MSNISRGRSPYPDGQDTGTIPDIRLHRMVRPDRGQSPEDLFYAKVGGLMDSFMHDLPLDCHSVNFKGDGWSVSIATDDDGNRELIGHFHNEPDKKTSTTFRVTQPNTSGDACANYKGPDGKLYEGDVAFDRIVKTIKPHLRQGAKPTTSAEEAGRSQS